MPLRLSDRAKRTAAERVYRTRMAHLRRLAKGYPSRAELARVLGVNASFISHLIGENPIRTIGEKLARDIEASLGLHYGWMDITH